MNSIPVKTIVGGTVRGTVIVSKDPISFLGEIDPTSGVITSKSNVLHGKRITNKIFVFPEGRGSTVGSYVIYNLKAHNVAPLAFVVNRAETIIVAGAILAEIPLFESITGDITNILHSGDIIEINSSKGLIKVVVPSPN